MKSKIELVTLTDVKNFCEKVSNINEDVFLVDRKHKYKVNAKSIIGCLLAQAEWSDVWVECEKDIYQTIKPWIIEGISAT